MSSRVLRKLQGDKELEILHNEEEEEDELNFTSVKSKKKQKVAVNPFDLVSKIPDAGSVACAKDYVVTCMFTAFLFQLNVDDEQSAEDSQDEQEEENQKETAENCVAEEKPSSTEPAEKQGAKKKRKKKKKKGKGETENGKVTNVSVIILTTKNEFLGENLKMDFWIHKSRFGFSKKMHPKFKLSIFPMNVDIPCK